MIFYGVLTFLAVAAGLVLVPAVVVVIAIQRLERMAPAPEDPAITSNATTGPFEAKARGCR
jgi:hypothetical protein